MKILFIHPFLYRFARGIERYTLNLANAFAEKGNTVSILTWYEKDQVQLLTPSKGVRVLQIPHFRYYVSKTVIPFYLFHFLTHSYDVILIHIAGYGEREAIALAQILKTIRYNIVFQYPHNQVPHRYREFLRYNTAENASQIIAVSNFVAGGIRECFGRESVVIGNGVDTKRFGPNIDRRAKMRQKMGISPQTPVLLTAAALEERKGTQWVICALPAVLQEFPDVAYYILGEGPYQQRLDELVNKLNLQSHVHFLGNQTNIEQYYQFADIGLLLSHGEASPLTALEYMASELPVIASHCPPFNEIIHPDCGQMVNASDPAEVANAIKCLLRDQNLRREMGKAGRRHVLGEHTWEKIADQYLT